MSEHDSSHVKIIFRYYSHILDKWMVETMWAQVVDAAKGFYKLDSIPFYGPLVASNDIVFAEYDENEQMLTYRNTVECSGNSIVLVVMMDKHRDINDIRNIFNDFGCHSEKVNEGYFSMEIPFDKEYTVIREKLL